MPPSRHAETPPEILRLVAGGRWPDDTAAMYRFAPVVPADVVRGLTAGEEDQLCPYPPPFSRLSDVVDLDSSTFWAEHGALGQIDASSVLVLGDFGIGADAVFVLEVGTGSGRVLRLRWGAHGVNEWIELAPSLSSLLESLGLTTD